MKNYQYIITFCFCLLACGNSSNLSNKKDHVHSNKSDSNKLQKLSDYIDDVKKSKFEDYESNSIRITTSEEFLKIKNYIISYYEGINDSQVNYWDERIVDCIKYFKQTSLENVRDSLNSKYSKSLINHLEKEREFQQEGMWSYDDYNSCDKTYIPVERILLEDILQFESLDSYLGGGKIRLNEEDGAKHYYATGYQETVNYGVGSTMNIWNPIVTQYNMSLSQLWISHGERDILQTIESGWQKYPYLYKNDNPNFFIYFTRKGYSPGEGCYNLKCQGFVQTSTKDVLGKPLTPSSTMGGEQTKIRHSWFLDKSNENWYLTYTFKDTTIVLGYYPKTAFKNGPITQYGDRITFGGESTGRLEAGQIGSGEKADKGYKLAAFQNNILFIDTVENKNQHADLLPIVPNPECYTAAIKNYRSLPDTLADWGTYMFFGGERCPESIIPPK